LLEWLLGCKIEETGFSRAVVDEMHHHSFDEFEDVDVALPRYSLYKLDVVFVQ